MLSISFLTLDFTFFHNKLISAEGQGRRGTYVIHHGLRMEPHLKLVLFCFQFNYVHFSKRVLLLYGDRTYLTCYLCMCHTVMDRRYQARQHHKPNLINITSISFSSLALQVYPMEIYTLHHVLGMSMIQFHLMIPSKLYPTFWCRWYYRYVTTAPFQPSSMVWFSLVQQTQEQYTSTRLTMKIKKKCVLYWN